jgi:hypothetical protein
LGSTGALEMSVFHGLSAGKTRQPATVGARPLDTGADDGVADATGVGVVPGAKLAELNGTDDDGAVEPPPPHAVNISTNPAAALRYAKSIS